MKDFFIQVVISLFLIVVVIFIGWAIIDFILQLLAQITVKDVGKIEFY